MNKDIQALSKIAVKIDMAYTAAGKKRLIKKRLLKRAFSVQKKLMKAIQKANPTADNSECVSISMQVLAWMQKRMDNKVGRTPQLYPTRKERRLLERKRRKTIHRG